jgi:hypothetical protein
MSAFEGRVDTTLIGPAGIGAARLEKEAEARLAKERAAASPYCGSDRRDRGKGELSATRDH